MLNLFLGSDLTKLMVVGGWPASESYKVEVVDLSGRNQTCSGISIRDSPIDYGSVGVFYQNKPMICGGFNIEYGTSDCYTYEKVIFTFKR